MADPAQENGTYGAFPTRQFARHPPKPNPNPPPKRAARETNFFSAAWKPGTHRGKVLKLNFEHLHETKDLFDHLARSPPASQKHQPAKARNKNCLNLGGHPRA